MENSKIIEALPEWKTAIAKHEISKSLLNYMDRVQTFMFLLQHPETVM